MKKYPILIADDEKTTREGLQQGLGGKFDCYIAANIKEAKKILESIPIRVLLIDLRLGKEDGINLLKESLKSNPEIIHIMMTAYGSQEIAIEAMKKGAWDFLMKPLNLDEIEILLQRAIREQEMTKENANLKKQIEKKPFLEKIIGKSTEIKQVLDAIEQIAPSRATVLIEGESGTGKELVSHAIHQMSNRPLEKLIAVSCSSLSPQLLESELFGHEKGAFTGAIHTRKGRFEEADGGTVFLDEIGEIDKQTQIKLLRVLSERTLERVGSNKSIPIDVRIICATNRNLQKLVNQELFREDLFFRLNVIKIEIPPLRKRREDIVILTNVFLKEFSKENKKQITDLDSKVLHLFQEYTWPGNIRQLRTAIEHAVVMCKGNKIMEEHLPQFIFQEEKSLPDQKTFNLKSLEKETIINAYKHALGNRKEMAKLLGISTRTLQRKIDCLKDELESL